MAGLVRVLACRLLRLTNLADSLRHVVTELRDANPGRVVLEQIAVDGCIHCDRGRIQQLLSNLLANAMTHGSPDQPVRVVVSVDAGALAISVSNLGAPIAPQDLEKVFEPYWRPATSQPGGGLGLGRYICSQIVKAHGGMLSVSSSAETGTCFVARIPRE